MRFKKRIQIAESTVAKLKNVSKLIKTKQGILYWVQFLKKTQFFLREYLKVENKNIKN